MKYVAIFAKKFQDVPPRRGSFIYFSVPTLSGSHATTPTRENRARWEPRAEVTSFTYFCFS
jgi:hypothetical protein